MALSTKNISCLTHLYVMLFGSYKTHETYMGEETTIHKRTCHPSNIKENLAPYRFVVDLFPRTSSRLMFGLSNQF